MKRDFTATTYIFKNEEVLLLFHPKHQKWLPPGGHIESDETPSEAARREVLEETGLEIDFLLQENIWINYPNAKSVERPYLCLLENIPAHQNQPAHQHIDFIYVATPKIDSLPLLDTCKWFSTTDLTQLIPDQTIFSDTLDIISNIKLNIIFSN